MSDSDHAAWRARREKRLPGHLYGSVRLCARGCLIDAQGDKDRAVELLHKRMESVVGSVFLSIAIQLAIKLIIWWISKGVAEPSVVSQLGEPGTRDEDFDDWDDQ